jgi:hypothetical protein
MGRGNPLKPQGNLKNALTVRRLGTSQTQLRARTRSEDSLDLSLAASESGAAPGEFLGSVDS